MLRDEHQLNTTEIALYFYLLEVCNATNWVNPFKRNSAKVMADLKMNRATFNRARVRLRRCQILTYLSVNGTANTTYQLADLEAIYRDRYRPTETGSSTGNDTGVDTGGSAGSDTLNKNSKQKPKPKQKQIIKINYSDAFDFFADTANNRLLQEKFGLSDEDIAVHFKTFYDSKIDLGGLDNKSAAEIAGYFYNWLPKQLAAGQQEKGKSSAKKESFAAPGQPVRGVAAALKFADVKMRGEGA